MSEPRLSVVITVVDGGVALQRCLTALLSQRDAPSLELLLPYDATIEETVAGAVTAACAGACPWLRCLPLGVLPVEVVRRGVGGEEIHHHVDRHNPKLPLVNRHDGAMTAQMLAASRGVGTADDTSRAVGHAQRCVLREVGQT